MGCSTSRGASIEAKSATTKECARELGATSKDVWKVPAAKAASISNASFSSLKAAAPSNMHVESVSEAGSHADTKARSVL